MRVKAMPLTSTVRGLFQEKLDTYNRQIGLEKLELERLGDGSGLYLASREESIRATKQKIEYLENDAADVTDKLILLDAHTAPRVMTEIEL